MVDTNSGEEKETLAAAIQTAVMEWCGRNGGFPISFICATDHIDADGEVILTVAEMDTQPTHRSLGLAAYLNEWYRDDARMLWDAQIPGRGYDE